MILNIAAQDFYTSSLFLLAAFACFFSTISVDCDSSCAGDFETRSQLDRFEATRNGLSALNVAQWPSFERPAFVGWCAVAFFFSRPPHRTRRSDLFLRSKSGSRDGLLSIGGGGGVSNGVGVGLGDANPELMRRPLRERIIHLLAIRPYKKPELITRLHKGAFCVVDQVSAA